ncbi:MAG: aldose 1-epimerase family protein [Nocardioides sp.]
MLTATGDQFTIAAADYQAVVSEGGATLRRLTYRDRPLIDDFPESDIPVGGRGQLLMPWVNRIRDGEYDFEGRTYRLPISEPAWHNASHGLVRWTAWTTTEQTTDSVTLSYRLMAQSGYPWTLDLRVRYSVGTSGLTVVQRATNTSPRPAPYASGAHPYLRVGESIDSLELTLPAGTRMLTDERKLPVGLEDIAGTDYDFRAPRLLGATTWDHAVSALTYADADRCRVVLRDPELDEGVELWADRRHRWFQIYSGDGLPVGARRSLAVEPMTAPPDAFRSGTDLVVLAAAGKPDSTLVTRWGITAANR